MGTHPPVGDAEQPAADLTDRLVPRLAGVWERISPAALGEPGFPALLEMHEATPTSGRYVGRRGPQETAFLLWDAGTWQWTPPDLLRLSTATDALEDYHVTVREPELAIDIDNVRLLYRRAATGRRDVPNHVTEGISHDEADVQAGPG